MVASGTWPSLALVAALVPAALAGCNKGDKGADGKGDTTESAKDTTESAKIDTSFVGEFVREQGDSEKGLTIMPTGIMSKGICDQTYSFRTVTCKNESCDWASREVIEFGEKKNTPKASGTINRMPDGSLMLSTTTEDGGCFSKGLSGKFVRKGSLGGLRLGPGIGRRRATSEEGPDDASDPLASKLTGECAKYYGCICGLMRAASGTTMADSAKGMCDSQRKLLSLPLYQSPAGQQACRKLRDPLKEADWRASYKALGIRIPSDCD